MTNKLKSSQIKYFLIRIIFLLFEELYKITGVAVYFTNLKDFFSEYESQIKVKRLLLKKLKSYKACIKEKVTLH